MKASESVMLDLTEDFLLLSAVSTSALPVAIFRGGSLAMSGWGKVPSLSSNGFGSAAVMVRCKECFKSRRANGLINRKI
jgi:hypothetical protein